MRDRSEWLTKIGSTKDPAKRARLYDEWGALYESDVVNEGYIMPAIMAGLVCRHVRKYDLPILDVGAGTGILGESLHELGYSNISALDYSQVMLDVCQNRGVYRDLFCMTMGKALDFPDGKFSTVLIMGVFGKDHAPAVSLQEIARITSANGLVIFSLRTDEYVTEGFRDIQEELEKKGIWKLLKATAPFNSVPLAKIPIINQIFTYRIC